MSVGRRLGPGCPCASVRQRGPLRMARLIYFSCSDPGAIRGDVHLSIYLSRNRQRKRTVYSGNLEIVHTIFQRKVNLLSS